MHIQYKKQAVKYINTCDKPTKNRLIEAIDKLPLGDLKKLSGYDKEYRLRVGDIRVLFTIEDESIIINSILPRGQAYKRV